MWLFVALVAIPLIEIGLFIEVGGALGLWPTLGLVILTAIAGTYLLRQQGSSALRELQGRLSHGGDPTEPLAHGALILISGVVLLTPGFFTDAVGLALLIAPVRRWVIGLIRKRMRVAAATASKSEFHMQEDVIDGEFEPSDTANNTDQPPSGWTRP